MTNKDTRAGGGLRRGDWIGLGALALWLTALLAYRAWYVEPREWGAICAASPVPMSCVPRAALIWLQYWDLWGYAALALGLAALLGAPLAVPAVAAGVAAVVNYNASWGMLGAALGAWAWLGRGRA